ncbi:MAG: RNA-binding domain-containing protein [Thiotrichales bacterium]
MTSFPFTALELASHIDEEQVAEVFVRINSKGTPLNQADFILTLMSVFWDEGRAELERFCKAARTPTKGEASPFNHFIHPDPDQLLRVCVGLGFKRGRLKYVYSILRGKDLETGAFSAERRDTQFETLKQAQSRVLNLQYWHDFLKTVLAAGYRSGKLISSQNNLLFAYILYLMGRTEYGVEEYQLRRLIARWFFMSALTGRYTGSPESQMEFDLARFRGLEGAEQFSNVLTEICDSTLTPDFWKITLPTELATSAARSPSMFAYFAALNLLDARVLFSQQKVSELIDPATAGHKSSLERHHLFPKAYLKRLGISDKRETNQIANYAMVEWGDNLKISDQPPAEYVPVLKQRFNGKELERMYYWHALPDDWENMEYREFLRQRRELMGKAIEDAYDSLAGAPCSQLPQVISVEDLVDEGETTTVEFKSTLRINLHTGEKDPRMELSVLKTLAAFLNSKGGSLIIGVADDGEPVGIEVDSFPNEDKMYLRLINLIKDRIGIAYMMYLHPRFDEYKNTRVLAVECLPAKSPVFVRDGNHERFYLRTGASTTELQGSQMQEYINRRFGGSK